MLYLALGESYCATLNRFTLEKINILQPKNGGEWKIIILFN